MYLLKRKLYLSLKSFRNLLVEILLVEILCRLKFFFLTKKNDGDILLSFAEVAEWQTRTVQVRVR